MQLWYLYVNEVLKQSIIHGRIEIVGILQRRYRVVIQKSSSSLVSYNQILLGGAVGPPRLKGARAPPPLSPGRGQSCSGKPAIWLRLNTKVGQSIMLDSSQIKKVNPTGTEGVTLAPKWHRLY